MKCIEKIHPVFWAACMLFWCHGSDFSGFCMNASPLTKDVHPVAENKKSSSIFETTHGGMRDRLFLREQNRLNAVKNWKERLRLTSDTTFKYDDNYLRVGKPDQKSDLVGTERVNARWGLLQVNKENLLKKLDTGASLYLQSVYSHEIRKERSTGLSLLPYVDWVGALGHGRSHLDLGESLTTKVSNVEGPNAQIYTSVQHKFNVKSSYRLSESRTLALKYDHTVLHYMDKAFKKGNLTTNTFTPEWGFDWKGSQTHLTVQPSLTRKRFSDKSKNADLRGLRIGLLRKLGERTEINFSGGRASQKLKATGAQIKAFVYSFGLKRQLTPKMALSVVGDRAITESLTVTEGIAAVQTETEALQNNNPTVIRTGLGTTLNYKFLPKWTASIGANYTIENNNASKTKLYAAKAGLSYAITPTLSFKVQYNQSTQKPDSGEKLSQKIVLFGIHWQSF